MLPELFLDIVRDRKSYLFRLAAIVGGAGLFFGLVSPIWDQWQPITALTARFIAFSVSPGNIDDTVSVGFFFIILQPWILFFTTVLEYLKLYFGDAAVTRIVTYLSYPLPRWQVFSVRVIYLATLTIGLTVFCTVMFLAGQLIVATGEVGWRIFRVIPGLLFLVVFFSNLVLLFTFVSSRKWIGILMGFCFFSLSYGIVLLSTVFELDSFFRYLTIVATYLDMYALAPHWSGREFIVFLSLNIVIIYLAWLYFNKADLSAHY